MKEDEEEEVLPTYLSTYIYIYVMYVCTLYYQYYRNALTKTYS